jgi:hypothetical protein
VHDGMTVLRRLISPSSLTLILLCFFLPFFSLSCESGFGGITITYSGTDLAFNGEPSVSGIPASELTDSDWEEIESGGSPLIIVALLSVLAGIGLGAGLPSALARRLSGAVSAGLALLLVLVNQLVMHSEVDRMLEEEAASADMFGAMATDMVSTHNEFGFWVVLLLLLGVAAYNVVELVRPKLAAPGAGPGPQYPGPQPPGRIDEHARRMCPTIAPLHPAPTSAPTPTRSP